MNPGSQLNTTLLGNTVESPEEEPFMGTDNGPHSTAENQKKQLIISCVSGTESRLQNTELICLVLGADR